MDSSPYNSAYLSPPPDPSWRRYALFCLPLSVCLSLCLHGDGLIACLDFVAFPLLLLLIEPFLKPLWHLCCCCCWCFSFVYFVRVVSLCYKRIFCVKDPFNIVIEETTSKGRTQKCLEKWAKNHTTVVSRRSRSHRCTQRHTLRRGDTR